MYSQLLGSRLREKVQGSGVWQLRGEHSRWEKGFVWSGGFAEDVCSSMIPLAFPDDPLRQGSTTSAGRGSIVATALP